jgi:hypothetical protein
MKDVLARCHKKTDVQVCTLTIVYYCLTTVNIHAIATYATFLWSAISNCACTYKSVAVTLTGVYFLQVKNKPWHPWVYTWFWHIVNKYLLLSIWTVFKFLLRRSTSVQRRHGGNYPSKCCTLVLTERYLIAINAAQIYHCAFFKGIVSRYFSFLLT